MATKTRVDTRLSLVGVKKQIDREFAERAQS